MEVTNVLDSILNIRKIFIHILLIKSSELGIYYVSGQGNHNIIPAKDILYKCVALPYKNGFITIPLNHEIKS